VTALRGELAASRLDATVPRLREVVALLEAASRRLESASIDRDQRTVASDLVAQKLELAREALAIGAGWVLDKSLYGLEGPTGVYWIQWYAPGSDLPLTIDFNSDYSSVAIDAIQVDTHWSATGPVLNVGPTLTVPEPASWFFAAGAAMVALIYQRRSRAHEKRRWWIATCG